MDHRRTNPGSIGRNNPKGDPPYHRAYKACIPCRNKKAKCSITADEYAAGLPCAKCRREMRDCTFTMERHGPIRRQRDYKNTQNDTDATGARNANAQPYSRATRELSPHPTTSPASLDQMSVLGDSHLADTMMTTVVSNGNDALNLLFEAAQHQEREVDSVRDADHHASSLLTDSPASPALTANLCKLPELSSDLLETWNAYRFVRMGWFSAEEAVWFVDMFFKNMAPLSPVLDEFYLNHSNHYILITQEPMLTCMILTISSRYHTLPAAGGQSRGYSIHQRLWEHCQHLLMLLVLGLERSSKAKTRTLGSIEALLLLTEWHPRALHAPPPSDGWDSDVLFSFKDIRDPNASIIDSPSRTRWREDVIEPAKRSDRMCWMVLSCAMSLANELGLFDKTQNENNGVQILSPYDQRACQRKMCLSKLIYVYQEQLSSRLGHRSMMPPSTSHAIICADTSDINGSQRSHEWASYMTAWTRLTKIVRSISDLLFPASAITSQIIQSGRYISMIEHVQSLLSTWAREQSGALSSGSHLHDMLMLEYQSTRIHTYSLGLQAIVSRTIAESNSAPSQSTCFNLTPTDFLHLQEVIDGSLAILKIAVKLSDQQVLLSCPIKVFLNITTASIFLLKGLGLGVSPNRLRDALHVLKEVISALRKSNPDDLHFGARYATLLEVHLARLQEKFVPSLRPPEVATQIDRQTETIGLNGMDTGWTFDILGNAEISDSGNDWLSLPLDASLVPFEMGNSHGLQSLGDGTLDFLWNLGV